MPRTAIILSAMDDRANDPLTLPPLTDSEARRYRKFKRIASIVSFVLTIGLLLALTLTVADEWLRDRTEGLTGSRPLGAAILFIYLYFALNILTFLPHVYGSLFLERRAGLSVQLFGSWVKDWVKGLVIGLAFGVAGAAALYGLIDAFPNTWWLIAGAGFTVFVVLLTNLAPVLLMPIFYKFEPLPEGPVRDRLLGLCERVGVRAINASVWKLSAKSKRSNAAVVGWGNTRKVIVSDTMLDTYEPDEIEAVLAHELGHHVSGDIRNFILVQTPVTFLSFLAIHLVIGWLDGPLDLTGREDLAGIPALALILIAVSLLALPLVNGYSRWREASADRFALDTIDDPDSFARAMDKLAGQNLADRNPRRLFEILFHSHPAIDKRIAMARERSSATTDAGAAGS
ncbi:MAG: M48 family metallopeptidase [Chloroflexi bacterium]|nr:M48 family metallopeptidase [Chloroflexota bacterium]